MNLYQTHLNFHDILVIGIIVSVEGASMIKRDWEDASHTIILVEVDNNWTWQEYDESSCDVKAMISSVDHPVIILADCQAVRHVPSDSLQRFYETLHEMPANLLGQVVVTDNRWLELIMKLLSQVVPEEKHKFRIARTMEKARKLIDVLQMSPEKRVSKVN
jgi:hypothetical protein